MPDRWLSKPFDRRERNFEPQPRCDQKVIVNGPHDRLWRIQRYGDDAMRCTFPAVCEIDGKHYCARHGGEIALRKLLD